jgi:hypothetical protein
MTVRASSSAVITFHQVTLAPTAHPLILNSHPQRSPSSSSTTLILIHSSTHTLVHCSWPGLFFLLDLPAAPVRIVDRAALTAHYGAASSSTLTVILIHNAHPHPLIHSRYPHPPLIHVSRPGRCHIFGRHLLPAVLLSPTGHGVDRAADTTLYGAASCARSRSSSSARLSAARRRLSAARRRLRRWPLVAGVR